MGIQVSLGRSGSKTELGQRSGEGARQCKTIGAEKWGRSKTEQAKTQMAQGNWGKGVRKVCRARRDPCNSDLEAVAPAPRARSHSAHPDRTVTPPPVSGHWQPGPGAESSRVC